MCVHICVLFVSLCFRRVSYIYKSIYLYKSTATTIIRREEQKQQQRVSPKFSLSVGCCSWACDNTHLLVNTTNTQTHTLRNTSSILMCTIFIQHTESVRPHEVYSALFHKRLLAYALWSHGLLQQQQQPNNIHRVYRVPKHSSLTLTSTLTTTHRGHTAHMHSLCLCIYTTTLHSPSPFYRRDDDDDDDRDVRSRHWAQSAAAHAL